MSGNPVDRSGNPNQIPPSDAQLDPLQTGIFSPDATAEFDALLNRDIPEVECDPIATTDASTQYYTIRGAGSAGGGQAVDIDVPRMSRGQFATAMYAAFPLSDQELAIRNDGFSPEQICNIQRKLKSMGYFLGDSGQNSDGIDGIIGRGRTFTRTAIIDFQKRHMETGSYAKGILCNATYEAIINYDPTQQPDDSAETIDSSSPNIATLDTTPIQTGHVPHSDGPRTLDGIFDDLTEKYLDFSENTRTDSLTAFTHFALTSCGMRTVHPNISGMITSVAPYNYTRSVALLLIAGEGEITDETLAQTNSFMQTFGTFNEYLNDYIDKLGKLERGVGNINERDLTLQRNRLEMVWNRMIEQNPQAAYTLINISSLQREADAEFPVEDFFQTTELPQEISRPLKEIFVRMKNGTATNEDNTRMQQLMGQAANYLHDLYRYTISSTIIEKAEGQRPQTFEELLSDRTEILERYDRR